MSESENKIDLVAVQRNSAPSYKQSIILTGLFIFVIVASIYVSGLLGNDFLTLYIFCLIFGFPLLIIYKDVLLSYVPENIANAIVGNVERVREETQEIITPETVPIYKTEYQTIFLAILCIGLSILILIRKKEEFIGIAMSFFFCVFGNLIVGELL
jgi:hypothetical protein